MLRNLGRALGAAATAIASVSLTILAFELSAPHWLPEWTPPAGDRRFWRYDELLGWHHRPGQEGMHRHRDFAVRVAINRDGLRDRVYPEQRTPGRPRMLFLGDSFGWGHGVERHEGVSERLEQREPRWEIVNASVSGYGTDQQLLWFDREGHRYAPDVVVVLFHPNDLLDNHRYSRYGYRKPVFTLAGDGLRLSEVPVPRQQLESRVERWLHLYSVLYPRVLELPDITSEALLAWRAPAPAADGNDAAVLPAVSAGPEEADPADRARSGTYAGLEDEHLEITRRLLHRLERDVAARGARLLVVSVRMVPHLRAFLADTLAEADVPHLPLDAAFADRPRDELHFAHDPHWNPAGHRVAADAIETFLREEGVFARTTTANDTHRPIDAARDG